MQSLTIKTTKQAPGKYMIEREDGESFYVHKARVCGKLEWIIERQSDLTLTGDATLRGAKFNIKQGWERTTRFQ